MLEIIETELARPLRSVDRACLLARCLQERHDRNEVEARTDKAVSRALAIRKAIQRAGIQLPPLRSISKDETVQRPAVEERLGGSTRRKLDEALPTREPAVFTLQEAQTILHAGSIRCILGRLEVQYRPDSQPARKARRSVMVSGNARVG